MSETWLQQYILLAFRIDKVVQAVYASPFVETYYGPPEWRAQVELEAEVAAAQLVRDAMALADALPVSRLFDHKVCHEAYPGHHTEYVLKEQHLYRQQGYVEQAICLTLSPQCVIQEGIAMMAHEMIFAEGEAEAWVVEHIYRTLQKDIDPEVLLHLRKASEMLGSVWDNAAILLDEGRPEPEVVQYFARYMLQPEDRAARMIASLQTPIAGLYNLTYVAGQKLMRPWLQGSDRLSVFRRFLTGQITPGQLELHTG